MTLSKIPLLKVKVIDPDKKGMQFCENDICYDLGRPEGYTTRSWKTIIKTCSDRQIIPADLIPTLQTSMFAVSMYGGLPGLILGGVSSVIIEDFAATPGTQTAGRLMPGVLNPKNSFALSLDVFVALRDGIRQCTQIYDTHPSIWIPDCDQEPRCKRELASGLNWGSDEQVQATSAEILWHARSDVIRVRQRLKAERELQIPHDVDDSNSFSSGFTNN